MKGWMGQPNLNFKKGLDESRLRGACESLRNVLTGKKRMMRSVPERGSQQVR